MPLVERELLPRLEADDLIVLDLELDAALLAAEAAVRLDQMIRLDTGAQPVAGHVGPVGTKLLNDQRGRRQAVAAIALILCSSSPIVAWASANRTRRQRGQIHW